MKLKKLSSLLLVLVLVVTVFVGCSSKDENAGTISGEDKNKVEKETAADEKKLDEIGIGAVVYDPNIPVNNDESIEIEFWYDNPGPEGYERYAKAIVDYQKIHPNVTIKVNSSLGWGDYWAKLPVSVVNGTGPDLMSFHLNWFGDFIPELAEPFPTDLQDAILKDFPSSEAMLYDEKMYTIPVTNMTGTIFYNKDMWEEAGLTEADIPKTWDELRLVARELTKTNDDGKIIVNGFDVSDGHLITALNYQNGYFVYEEDGKTTQMDNVGAMQGAQFLQDLIKVDKVYAPGSGAPQERFGNGQSAMMYNWTWAGAWLKGNIGNSIKWDVFPTPTFEGSKVVDRNNPEVSAIVNANSSDTKKAVAMDFLKFYFASDEYMVELANSSYTVPVKRTCANTVKDNNVVQVVSTYIDKTIWTGITPSSWDTFITQIFNDEILLQGKDVTTCLKKFDAENAKAATEVKIATAERKSPLAQFLK